MHLPTWVLAQSLKDDLEELTKRVEELEGKKVDSKKDNKTKGSKKEGVVDDES